MNKTKTMLIKTGISNNNSIIKYYPTVRDRNDVSVLRCEKSGVIILDRTDHIDVNHYEKMKGCTYFGAENRNMAIMETHEDDERRCDKFKGIILNKKWLDIGAGVGGALIKLSPYASETHAVEPQIEAYNNLLSLGYQSYRKTEEAPKEYFNVVTLFHTLEHFTDQIAELETIKKVMAKNAKIIIEVPHANDFLISFLDCEPFKKATFWSEHLILHTRISLEIILKKVGFRNITVSGIQRYPLSNHLHWLSKGKPGGHRIWSELRTKELDNEYEKMLSRLDKTDTLIAQAQK